MVSRVFRRFFPHALGLVAAVVTWFLVGTQPKIPESVFSPVVSSLSILVSFLGAANSILLSMSSGRLLKRLRTSGIMKRVRVFLNDSFRACFFAIPLTVVALALHQQGDGWPPWYRALFAVWVGATTWSLTACFRLMRLYIEIVTGHEEDMEADEAASLERLKRASDIAVPHEHTEEAPPALPPVSEKPVVPVKNDAVASKKERRKKSP